MKHSEWDKKCACEDCLKDSEIVARHARMCAVAYIMHSLHRGSQNPEEYPERTVCDPGLFPIEVMKAIIKEIKLVHKTDEPLLMKRLGDLHFCASTTYSKFEELCNSSDFALPQPMVHFCRVVALSATIAIVHMDDHLNEDLVSKLSGWVGKFASTYGNTSKHHFISDMSKLFAKASMAAVPRDPSLWFIGDLASGSTMTLQTLQLQANSNTESNMNNEDAHTAKLMSHDSERMIMDGEFPSFCEEDVDSSRGALRSSPSPSIFTRISEEKWIVATGTLALLAVVLSVALMKTKRSK